jgi:hypothetical protein
MVADLLSLVAGEKKMDMRNNGRADMKVKIADLAMMLVIAAGAASGQRWGYTGQFENSPFPPFSTGVISGNFCILGAEVFHWDGTRWSFHQKLERGGQEDPMSYQLDSVCIQDDHYLVGVPMDYSQEDPYKGRVYAYRLIENNWQLEQKIEVDNTSSFGSSIALDGDTAIIVAYPNPYFYEYREGRWEQVARTAPCPENQGIQKIVKSGDHWLVVGVVRGNFGSGPDPIVANLYRLEQDQWILLDAIRFEDGVQDVFFKEDHLAVLTESNTNQSDILMYHFDGQAWKPIRTLFCHEEQWRYGIRMAFSSTPGDLVLADILDSPEAGTTIINFYAFQNGRWDLVNRIESYLYAFYFPVLDHEHLIIPDGVGTVFSYRRCPSADLTGDCRVDLADFAALANEWMTGPGNIR